MVDDPHRRLAQSLWITSGGDALCIRPMLHPDRMHMMAETPGKSDNPVHEGGCLCGQVRFRLVGDPLAVHICHCTHCKRNSGSDFSVTCLFPREALTMQGTPSVYDDFGDTGQVVRRVFCGSCGTPIELQSSYSFPRYAAIKVGTFDNPDTFVPDDEVYCSKALPWFPRDPNRPRYDAVTDNRSTSTA